MRRPLNPEEELRYIRPTQLRIVNEPRDEYPPRKRSPVWARLARAFRLLASRSSCRLPARRNSHARTMTIAGGTIAEASRTPFMTPVDATTGIDASYVD